MHFVAVKKLRKHLVFSIILTSKTVHLQQFEGMPSSKLGM